MPIIRAQVRFQGRTGLPEDQFVNTLHFETSSEGPGAVSVALTEALRTFYDVLPVGGALPLSNRYSSFVNVPVQVRFYNLSDPEPRVPVVTTFSLANRQLAPTNLPEEVAVCASFSSAPPITPSTRGRIYLGPLISQAFDSGAADTRCRVAAAFIADIAKSCERLVAQSDTANANWCVYSPKTGLSTHVARGHVDNAPDTQRRRGPDALTRVIWPSPA